MIYTPGSPAGGPVTSGSVALFLVLDFLSVLGGALCFLGSLGESVVLFPEPTLSRVHLSLAVSGDTTVSPFYRRGRQQAQGGQASRCQSWDLNLGGLSMSKSGCFPSTKNLTCTYRTGDDISGRSAGEKPEMRIM